MTHKAFWESGEALRVLSAQIDLTIPIRLVHGLERGPCRHAYFDVKLCLIIGPAEIAPGPLCQRKRSQLE